jgi:hypothetical protein
MGIKSRTDLSPLIGKRIVSAETEGDTAGYTDAVAIGFDDGSAVKISYWTRYADDADMAIEMTPSPAPTEPPTKPDDPASREADNDRRNAFALGVERGRSEERKAVLAEVVAWLEGQSAAIIEHASKGGEAFRGRKMAGTLDIAADHFRALASKASS